MKATMFASRLKLCAAALFSSLALSCSGGGEDRADLSLFFTGTINGYIEPCGCVSGQIGGIDRSATYIRTEMEANPNSLFVETGDLVSEEFVLDDAVLQQISVKAAAFLSVWADLGCSAMALGENDLLTLGVENLKKLEARFGIPMLCGNLIDKSGEHPFESYTIVERGGKRIGIFSLLAPRVEQPIAKDPELVDIAAKLRPHGLRVQNWKARAKEIVEELLPQTDMILCASHLGFNLNRKLAEAQPQIDLIFGGHFGDAEKERYTVERTPVLISLFRGSRVDRVDWWWPQPDEYFFGKARRKERGHGKLIDESNRGEIEHNLEVAVAEFDAIGKREKAHPPEDYTLFYEDKVAFINGAERAFNSLEEVEDVNRFIHTQKPMHRAIARDEYALARIDTYHEELQDLWKLKNAKSAKQQQATRYVGPKACTKCHPRQVEFWKATRHSFALATLETSRQDVDAECFYCHTVGYRLEGGFHRPGRHDGYENVQCAACHGPGADHMSGGTSYFNPEFLSPSGAASCEQCHNKIHDPNFGTTKWRKLPLVMCPSIEPVEQRNSAMLMAAAEAAQGYLKETVPRWSELIHAYRKAGLNDDALRVAEGWVAERPKSKDAHLAVGHLFLDANRREEAVKHFEYVTRKAPLEPSAWSGLARALMYKDPERAIGAAKEALSFEQGNPGHIRTIAEILIADGRVAAAADVVRGFTEVFPQHTPFLIGLFEEEVPSTGQTDD